MAEENPCKNTKKLADWLREEKQDEEACRPCNFPVLGNWYISELKEKGREDLAKEIQDAGDTEDAMGFAEKLDQVKEKVTPKLKERLKEFDCTVQKFDEEQSQGR